ncbi:MAG: NfeD family protein [Planctomycetaceae bacterium]
MPDAGVLATILLIVGLFLLALELMIPSFGIIGICSAISLLISAWCAWQAWWGTSPGFFWTYVSFWLLGIPAVFVGMLVVMQYTSIGDAVVLRGPGRDSAASSASARERTGLESLVGNTGKALSLLTPGGMVSVAGERFHAESPGMLIEPGTAIQVIGVKGTRLVVKEAKPVTSDALARTVVPASSEVGDDDSGAEESVRPAGLVEESAAPQHAGASSGADTNGASQVVDADILDFDVPENYTAG